METFDVIETGLLFHLFFCSFSINKKINDLGKKIEELHDRSYFG